MYRANTLTTLAQDLNNGDSVMYLTDSSNWLNTGTAGVSTHTRSIILWDYSNSFGYLYPPETYSRRWYGNAWNPAAISGNNITLRTSWAGGFVAAGTQLSNGNSGGTYKYHTAGNSLTTESWVERVGYIGTIDYSGTNVGSKFPPGTAYVKHLMLLNRSATSAAETWVGGISYQLDVETPAGSQTKADSAVTLAGTNANSADKTAGAVGGWTIDSDAIYSGTKDTSGYTSGAGITLASAGSIHSKDFYIDTSGNANFQGTVKIGTTDLTASNTLNTNTTKANVGLSNVDNDSTSTIRSGTTKTNVGLSNVDNDSTSSIRSGTTKANVGLSNVDNESGADTIARDKVSGAVGGWTIDSDAIYSGTKDTSGYTSGAGITLASAGSIHSKDFYIDTSGNANFQGTVKIGTTDLTEDNTLNIKGMSGSGINVCNPEYSDQMDIGVPFSSASNSTPGIYQGTVSGRTGNIFRILATGSDAWTYFGTSTSNYNAPITPNRKWLISAWVRHNSISGANGQLYMRFSNGSHIVKAFSTGSIGTWTRVSGVIDATTNPSDSFILRADNDAGSQYMYFDGIMVEEYLGDGTLTEPSNYVRPLERRDKTSGSVAGWNINSTKIYSGSSVPTVGTDGYTNAGMILNSNGDINSEEFSIVNGSAKFSGALAADTVGASQLTISTTGSETGNTSGVVMNLDPFSPAPIAIRDATTDKNIFSINVVDGEAKAVVNGTAGVDFISGISSISEEVLKALNPRYLGETSSGNTTYNLSYSSSTTYVTTPTLSEEGVLSINFNMSKLSTPVVLNNSGSSPYTSNQLPDWEVKIYRGVGLSGTLVYSKIFEGNIWVNHNRDTLVSTKQFSLYMEDSFVDNAGTTNSGGRYTVEATKRGTDGLVNDVSAKINVKAISFSRNSLESVTGSGTFPESSWVDQDTGFTVKTGKVGGTNQATYTDTFPDAFDQIHGITLGYLYNYAGTTNYSNAKVQNISSSSVSIRCGAYVTTYYIATGYTAI